MKKAFLAVAAIALALTTSGAALADSNAIDARGVHSVATISADTGARDALVERTEAMDGAGLILAQYRGWRRDDDEFDSGDGYEGGSLRGYCAKFAQGMVAIGAEAVRQGCVQYGPLGLNTNYGSHFRWCLRNPDRVEERAAGLNALLSKCPR